MNTVPSRGPDGFYHPANEEQIVALVKLARARRCALRVRGSAHSVPAAVHTDAHLDGRALAIDVMLDRCRRVEIDEARGVAVVEAGCHLGVDPRDPTGASTWESSLVAQLDARGWALPDLGGVTHQTISGFLLTGSSGGSVQHAVEDAVLAIRFIDGHGRVHDAVRESDLFDAVVCSMGLLGVVTRVILQCVRRYDVIGLESITPEDGATYDPFGEGDRSLHSFLRKAEYSRILWWPQRRVERLVTWQARRMRDIDYDAETAPGGSFRPKPYQVVGDGIPDPRWARPLSRAAQSVCGSFLDGVDALATGYARAEKRAPRLAPLGRRLAAGYERVVLPSVLRTFVSLDQGSPQRFWGPWHDVLPMDNPMSEESLPTTFTEIWIPLEDAARAMRALRDCFREGGHAATGSYIYEIYAARATRGWLHPGHGRDSLRIDVFWFAKNRRSPIPFFERYWDLLAPFGYRLHWGKHLPNDEARGHHYLRRRFPKWDDFLRLRAELDPAGLFLNHHFERALGIPPGEAAWPARDEKAYAIETRVPPPTDGADLPARVQAFYESMATRGDTSMDRFEDLFAPGIHFRDPFRETHGIEAFRVLFERMFRQYKSVWFTDFHRSAGDGNTFTLTYKMHLRMKVGPAFTVSMASIFTAEDGKVASLVDYFDFVSGLVSPVDTAARSYRAFTNRLFL